MNIFEVIDNGCIYIFNELSNINVKSLTPKEKYDMLLLTARYQNMIFEAYNYFGKGVKDYQNKKIRLDNGINLSMIEVERRESTMLRARFILVDLQKALLDIDDLMLDGTEAIKRLQHEADII